MTALRKRRSHRRHVGITAVVAIAVAASALVLTSSGGAGGNPKVRIALVLPDFAQNTAILDVKKGAEAAAKKLGAVEVITTGNISADGQVKAIETAIAAKVDVILYDTIDGKALSPAIEKANQAGAALSRRLYEQGVVVQPIGPPYVPAGTSRLRVIASAAHSDEDIEAALSAFSRAS